MEAEYIQQFIKAIRKQNQLDKFELSDEIFQEIKLILLEPDNLINILVRLK